jgi:hypothetical protein
MGFSFAELKRNAFLSERQAASDWCICLFSFRGEVRDITTNVLSCMVV